MGIKKAFKSIGQSLGFVAPDVEEVDSSQAVAANQQAVDNLKSSEQLTQEGNANASATAANAGVLAADNARNAMANSGGGKLARALMAAQAGNEASQNAFNQNVNQAISTAQNQNQAQSSILANNAKAIHYANVANANAQNEATTNKNDALAGIMKPVIGTAGSVLATKLFSKKKK